MLTIEQKEQFEREGYLAVEGVLEGPLLQAIRDAAVELGDADPRADRRIWHERALFRRKPFRDLLDCMPLIQAARDLLGEDVQLLALDLLLVRAGKGNTGWHRDVSFVCSKTLSINTGIYLQDMTEPLGLLGVVPGSHRRQDLPPKDTPVSGDRWLAAKAGTAVFFDAGLWHTGGPNRSAEDRWALFPYFGHYWVKRMDNYFTQALPAEFLATSDPMKRQLLGLGLRQGVTSYHGDDEGYNRRGEPGIDFPASPTE